MSPSAWVSCWVKAGSGAVLAVDWAADSLVLAGGAGVVLVAAVVVLAGVLAGTVAVLLWVGAEAAVTVVVVEPHAASSAAQAGASIAVARTRRGRVLIAQWYSPPVPGIPGCRTRLTSS